MEHCNFCGRDGHNHEECFKQIGYPKWWLGKGKREKIEPKAACIDAEPGPIARSTTKQNNRFTKHFAKE